MTQSKTQSKHKLAMFVVAIFSFALPSSLVGQDAADSDWNRFRGPNGSGISSSSDVPTEWSVDKNMAWKTELPGPGSSSPIVQGDKVFLTCYTGFGLDVKDPGEAADLKRHLVCIDRETGKELWVKTVDSTSDEDAFKGFIVEHGYASSTPVTDGEHIFVFYGKTGVIAYDMDGEEKWQTNVGTNSDPAKWGGGASPILFDDKVIVNAGIEGHALIALNKSDGSEAWRLEDEKFTNNWSTPSLVEVDGRTELIYSVPDKLIAINPDNGEQLWHAASPIKNSITASVVAHEGIIYTLGGRQGRAIAVRCGGDGDVSDTHTVWTQSVKSSIGTPLILDGHLYWLASGGIATCLKLEDGSEVNRARLESSGPQAFPNGSYASPIIVGDKMYFVRRSGTAHVITASPELTAVQDNNFGEDKSLFNGTPAVAGNQLFIRSDKMLYCIAKDE